MKEYWEIPLYSDSNHYTDWSELLDAPAGKHGRVKISDGRFVFENGQTARFWGVNLVGGDCFPEKEVAEKLAKRLSMMGCNLVRLHHMDAWWAKPNIFGNQSSTLILDEQLLDRLDYLVFCLKQHGIYIFLDLLVNRKFGRLEGFKEEEVMAGGKQQAFFDADLIFLQKEYIRQLFTHVNTYTKTTYASETALVGCLIINEASVFITTNGTQLSKAAQKKMQTFQKEKAGIKKLSKFNIDYTRPAGAVVTEKSYGSEGFLYHLERDYYANMYGFLRNDLGVECLIAGSNFPLPMVPTISTNSSLDFMAVNAYWDHPQLEAVEHNWSEAENAPIDNRSLIKQEYYFYNSLVHLISRFKVENKPLLVTEWNACKPNEYVVESLPYMAAYGRLQGWDGCCQFSFEQPFEQVNQFSSFDFAHSPDMLAQWCVAAPLFLGDYLPEAETTIIKEWEKESLVQDMQYNDVLDKMPLAPFHAKIVNNFVSGKAKELDYATFQELPLTEKSPVIMDAEKGLLQLRTDKVHGLVGFPGDEEYDFPMFKVKISNEFVSVVAISKDQKPLLGSQKIILVAATKAKENRSKQVLEVEPVNGYIVFKHELKSTYLEVKPLYLDKSEESWPITLEPTDVGMKLNLNLQETKDGKDGLKPTMVYGINIKY